MFYLCFIYLFSFDLFYYLLIILLFIDYLLTYLLGLTYFIIFNHFRFASVSSEEPSAPGAVVGCGCWALARGPWRFGPASSLLWALSWCPVAVGDPVPGADGSSGGALSSGSSLSSLFHLNIF
ncbi:hypothetical protein NQD34_008335 [Periophthalmus magnuspinnatus]|nr:hypothetical protein NQD34_008335 [Periophthalmus magnuspinnatus]